jgi:hypothetical protein
MPTQWFRSRQSGKSLQLLVFLLHGSGGKPAIPEPESQNLTSIPRSYTGSSIVADVSFDMFTSTSTGSDQYEIMIWLAALGGAGPIGSAIETTTISGTTWKLYYDLNGSTKVYSFVAESEVTSSPAI